MAIDEPPRNVMTINGLRWGLGAGVRCFEKLLFLGFIPLYDVLKKFTIQIIVMFG